MRIDQPTMKQRSTSISSSTSTTSQDDEGQKMNVEPIKTERNSKENQRLPNKTRASRTTGAKGSNFFARNSKLQKDSVTIRNM